MNDPVELLRRVGASVEAGLQSAGLESRAHVGLDVRDEWLRRVPGLTAAASVNWVAFDFAGLPIWDVHLGVLIDVETEPPRSTVGFHVLEQHWPLALDALCRGDAVTARALAAEAVAASTIREVQLNDPWGELDLSRIAEESDRLAARAVELYWLVQPRVRDLAASLAADESE